MSFKSLVNRVLIARSWRVHSALWMFEQRVASVRQRKLANVRQCMHKTTFDSSVCRRVASVQRCGKRIVVRWGRVTLVEIT